MRYTSKRIPNLWRSKNCLVCSFSILTASLATLSCNDTSPWYQSLNVFIFQPHACGPVHAADTKLQVRASWTHFCLQTEVVRTYELSLHGYRVSESSLKVLIQDVTTLWDSVEEHVHRHETESFAVHLESVWSDAPKIEGLGRPLEPPSDILSTPSPWISCVRKEMHLLNTWIHTNCNFKTSKRFIKLFSSKLIIKIKSCSLKNSWCNVVTHTVR